MSAPAFAISFGAMAGIVFPVLAALLAVIWLCARGRRGEEPRELPAVAPVDWERFMRDLAGWEAARRFKRR